MNKKIAPSPKLPAQFYVFVSALAFGFACSLVCFMGGGLLSPVLPLSQSPALLAICIATLSFYSEKSKSGFFRAALLLLAFYFAFIVATGNLLALLPLAASLVISFPAKDGFKNRKLSFACAVAAISSSVASAAFSAASYLPLLLAKAENPDEMLRERLGELFASKLSLAGYTAFAIVPIIFFVALAIHIQKADK